MTACKSAKVPAPKLRYERTGIWVECKVPGGVRPETAPTQQQKSSVNSSVKTTARILQALENNPQMTLSEIAVIMGLTTRAVEKSASKLVKEGHLKYVGPQKGGHWEVAK